MSSKTANSDASDQEEVPSDASASEIDAEASPEEQSEEEESSNDSKSNQDENDDEQPSLDELVKRDEETGEFLYAITKNHVATWNSIKNFVLTKEKTADTQSQYKHKQWQGMPKVKTMNAQELVPLITNREGDATLGKDNPNCSLKTDFVGKYLASGAWDYNEVPDDVKQVIDNSVNRRGASTLQFDKRSLAIAYSLHQSNGNHESIRESVQSCKTQEAIQEYLDGLHEQATIAQKEYMFAHEMAISMGYLRWRGNEHENAEYAAFRQKCLKAYARYQRLQRELKDYGESGEDVKHHKKQFDKVCKPIQAYIDDGNHAKYIELRDQFKEKEGADKFVFDDRKLDLPGGGNINDFITASMVVEEPGDDTSILDSYYAFCDLDKEYEAEEPNFLIINTYNGTRYDQSRANGWWLDLLRNSQKCLEKLDAIQQDLVRQMLIQANEMAKQNNKTLLQQVEGLTRKLTDPKGTDRTWYCNARDYEGEVDEDEYEKLAKKLCRSETNSRNAQKKRKSTTPKKGSARKKSRASASSSSGKKKPRSSNV